MNRHRTGGNARPRDPFRGANGVLCIAHRGGSLLWPENTLTAFKGAMALGVDVLELDLHATRDGQLVVIHDDVVDRVTEGAGRVKDRTLEELKRLDAGYRFSTDGQSYPFRGTGCRIPTFEEVLDAAPDHWINVDLKQTEPSIVERFVTLVRRRRIQDRLVVGSFNFPTLQAFRRACPEVRTAAGTREAYLFYGLHQVFLHGLYRRGPAIALQIPRMHRGNRIVTRRFVASAHRKGLAVHVWTINEMEVMKELIDVGVDGIVTDRPDLLLQLRAEEKKQNST